VGSASLFQAFVASAGSCFVGPVGTITGIRYPSAVSYQFEWDATKATSNLKDHKVSFEEASTVFGDPLAMLMADPDHSGDEERYLLLGTSLQRRLLVVSFAERPPRTRLISSREATRRERRQYEEGKT
jgi:uncharacterized DUF497 family protein